MKIAIPVTYGQLSAHFGHCEKFALVDVDATKKEITATDQLTPPPHEPGILPVWLQEQGVELVIAGGMGQRAQQLFIQNGIQVIVGARSRTIEDIVQDYLQGSLETGDNLCDH